MVRKTIAATLVIMLNVNLMAGVVPGRWEKLEKEGMGRIVVTLFSGDVFVGTYKSVTRDALYIYGNDGKEQFFRKADVSKVITADVRRDSLSNGAWIGALCAGLPTTALYIAALDGDEVQYAILGGLIWSGIGALIGIGIDAAVKGQTTLYEAKPPKLSDSSGSNK